MAICGFYNIILRKEINHGRENETELC